MILPKKRKVLIYLSVLLFIISISFCFEFEKNSINLKFGETKQINFIIKNEKNYSVTYHTHIDYLGCNNYLINCNNTDINISTFEKALFNANEIKTAILTITSKNTIENTYRYIMYLYDNESYTFNQSFFINTLKKEKDDEIKKINNKKKEFQINNIFFLFLIVLFFCYLGISLFIRAFGKPLTKEIFFLVLILSAIVITIAVKRLFG
jgi:hypothetical protein